MISPKTWSYFLLSTTMLLKPTQAQFWQAQPYFLTKHDYAFSSISLCYPWFSKNGAKLVFILIVYHAEKEYFSWALFHESLSQGHFSGHWPGASVPYSGIPREICAALSMLFWWVKGDWLGCRESGRPWAGGPITIRSRGMVLTIPHHREHLWADGARGVSYTRALVGDSRFPPFWHHPIPRVQRLAPDKPH